MADVIPVWIDILRLIETTHKYKYYPGAHSLRNV